MTSIPIQKPFIIAHRGSAHTCPENTIAAFEAAIALQVDMIEFDVRSTQDQVLVIHHDAAIEQTPICQLTWADLQAKYSSIPSLEETLKCCKNRILLDVELKEVGQEVATIKQLLRYLDHDEFVITSFNLESLQIIKQNYPEVTIGLLLKRSWQDRWFDRNWQVLQSQITQLQPNFLAPHTSLLRSQWLQQINLHNLPYWVWTVNQANQMHELIDNPSIHAIITDNVNLGLAMRKQLT